MTSAKIFPNSTDFEEILHCYSCRQLSTIEKEKIPSEMEVAPLHSIKVFLSYQIIGFLNNQTDSHRTIVYLER